MVRENINLYTAITALAFSNGKGEKKIMVMLMPPQGAMGLKLWGSLASKLTAYPIALDPRLRCQACP